MAFQPYAPPQESHVVRGLEVQELRSLFRSRQKLGKRGIHSRFLGAPTLFVRRTFHQVSIPRRVDDLPETHGLATMSIVLFRSSVVIYYSRHFPGLE